MPVQAKSSRDVIVRTTDLTAAVSFYESALGFKASPCGEGLFRIETGSITLYVEKGAAHGPVFDFWVADVAAAREQLLAAGCTLVEENPSVPRCYLKDPFGITFNLGKAPASRIPSERT